MSALPPDVQHAIQRQIRAPLGNLRRRTRWYLVVAGVLRLLAALLGAGLIQLVLDRWLRLSLDQRLVLNIAITVGWLIVIHRYLVAPLFRPLSDATLAGWVDRRHPQLADALSTAVEFSEQSRPTDASEVAQPQDDQTSPELVADVLRGAADAAGRVRFDAVLNHRRAQRNGMLSGALLLTIVAAFLIDAGMMNVWFQRNWLLADLAWPQRTYIVPEHFDNFRRRMPRGEELEVFAKIVGEVPQTATLRWRTASGRKGREPMTRLGGQTLFASIGVLSEDVTFEITGGDENTPEYTVIAVERPRLVRTRAIVVPPTYTRQDTLELEQQTVFDLLQGASLTIEAEVNKPLQRARFVAAEGQSVGTLSTRQEEGRSLVTVALPTPESGVYRFELLDRDTIENRDPVPFTIKVSADQPPDVQMEVMDVGELITPKAEFDIALRAEDAYGLGRVSLSAQRNEDPLFAIPLPELSSQGRTFAARQLWAPRVVRVTPGDRLRLSAAAADRDPAGPNVGQTPVIEIGVVSIEDFQAAMAERELELRREFERLMSAQRRIQDGLVRLFEALPNSGPAGPRESQRLTGLIRQQAAHTGRCAAIAQRFERILAEMRSSRVARVADERRILDRIVAPLRELATEAMPDAGEVLGQLRQDGSTPSKDAALAAQNEVLRQMRVVLGNMLEWEGYREAVLLLQQLISDQDALRTETLQALETELEAILGEDEPLEDFDEDAPKP